MVVLDLCLLKSFSASLIVVVATASSSPPPSSSRSLRFRVRVAIEEDDACDSVDEEKEAVAEVVVVADVSLADSGDIDADPVAIASGSTGTDPEG